MLHDIRRTIPKLHSRLEYLDTLVYRRAIALPPARMLELSGPSEDPFEALQKKDAQWTVLPPGASWGRPHQDFLLKFEFKVEAHQLTDMPVAIYLPIGQAGDFSHPETTVYLDEELIGACDRHHQEIYLPPSKQLDGSHSLLLHGWTGIRSTSAWAGGGSPADAIPLLMGDCALVQVDEPLRAFIALARVALGIAEHLPDVNPSRSHLLSALHEAFLVLDTRHPIGDAFYGSIPAATERLRQGIADAGEPLDVDLYAIGHAHLDLAWLWPLSNTRKKAHRTSMNVLALMERWPDFHFVQSQPQLYEFIREEDPALFDAIRARVEQGRWEPIGGMWVEADCNLSGAEALARQFVLGREYFRQHFGPDAESPVLWLPDVFGFPWSLPQLASEAGIQFFFTTKLGWNQYNRLPYDSFWWRGLDGTQILAHFGTARSDSDVKVSNYNAQATPEEVLNAWSNYQQKDWGPPGLRPVLLMPYGHGDGGGGPTSAMASNLSIMHKFPTTPAVHQTKAIEFFRRLESEWGERLPTWDGELYLEYHQGTFTTQARNKRANRRSEFLLHDAELVLSMAQVLKPEAPGLGVELQSAWKLLCLNQFHDILPGSSIGEVYAESEQQYAEIADRAEHTKSEAVQSLAPHFQTELLIINPTSFARRDLALLGTELSLQSDLGGIPIQKSEEGLLLDIGITPPLSIIPIDVVADRSGLEGEVEVSDLRLENDQLLVEFSEAGDLKRIFDKEHDREVLPRDSIANQLQAFEDRPSIPDAWDTEIFFDDRLFLADAAESIEIRERGPLRGALEIRRRLRDSLIIQRITLMRGSRRLDFVTRIDWHERYTLLKAAFPVNVLSAHATYEIPWGSIERPTHRNTSWDWARFELPAQKWIDLSEGDYGVSLLNNGRYGHDVHKNVMRISLLRGTVRPDPLADLGEHHFTYSLLPHIGKWGALTQAEAYALNDPLVIIETVKPAEDGNGIIVRMYESQRHRGSYRVMTGFDLRAVWRTNLLEENLEQLPAEDQEFAGAIDPFQILTLRLVPRLKLD
jgi:alpha-mannosidase